MNKLHVKYLIVGGGAAGSAAAEAIRLLDRQGDVWLIAQESTRPYRRETLSREALRQHLPRAALFIHQPGWYAENRIELSTGRRAVQLDTSRHCVILDDAQEITYDKLLLATGSSPRHLVIQGHDLPGLHYLRNYEDMERLHHAAEKARAEGHRHLRTEAGRGRVAVIGSGLLAVELAASLTQMGLEIDLLLKGEHPWTKFAGPSAGKWLARHLEQHGIAVRAQSAPIRIEGDGRVQRVVLPTQEALLCDFAVAAVGAVANRELLRGTPIAAERAILTDPCCRTNAEDVYAAGDCAAIFDPIFNKYRALDHFECAKTVGALAGRNMAGLHEVYADVNHFGTELFGVKISVWGEARHVHHRLVRGLAGADGADFVEFGLTGDNRISQAIAINHADQHAALADLVRRRVDMAGREEVLKDPGAGIEGLG